MPRNIMLAAGLASVLAVPAIAVDTSTSPQSGASTEQAKPRANVFSEQQAREHLTKSGYTEVSELTKDGNGAWSGTATKDGKTIGVSVGAKGVVPTN